MIKNIEWISDHLRIIDQTKIPQSVTYLDLYSIDEVKEAIQKLRVRGAPAIGITAAYGLYLGIKDSKYKNNRDFIRQIKLKANYLADARPTAVNLSWALNKICKHLENETDRYHNLVEAVLEIAKELEIDDHLRCEKIGEHGAGLIKDGMSVLTHCNAGLLATSGIGTALGIIYTAARQGKKIKVYVDETRPLLQGARLTMWELQQAGIPATLITDNMAAYAMQRGKVDLVIVGADRIATNGDVANKIGTFGLAVNSNFHHIPFYVAAPLSTFDSAIESGDDIPIEERKCEEVTNIWDKLSITVQNADCWNPAFDVTPEKLITGIVTEVGILTRLYSEAIKKFIITKKVYQIEEELNP
jgi:methylthioribose-1-phosphate isomerase